MCDPQFLNSFQFFECLFVLVVHGVEEVVVDLLSFFVQSRVVGKSGKEDGCVFMNFKGALVCVLEDREANLGAEVENRFYFWMLSRLYRAWTSLVLLVVGRCHNESLGCDEIVMDTGIVSCENDLRVNFSGCFRFIRWLGLFAVSFESVLN